jgi:transcription elongation factor GreA
MSTEPITKNGVKMLQDELASLTGSKRQEVIKAIAEARAHGDLKENAEYHAAKDKQSFTEGRITELEDVISRSEVIDLTKLTGKTITFGTKIKIVDEATDLETFYEIVGPYEADLNSGLISIASPIAKALIGKEVGSSVEVITPRGKKNYEVLSINVLKS